MRPYLASSYSGTWGGLGEEAFYPGTWELNDSQNCYDTGERDLWVDRWLAKGGCLP